MHNHNADFDELRPTGEASHIPDEQLNEGCGADPERQRVATSVGGYPDEPTDASGECRSCGASIPASQTKCQFCRTNHLGDEAASSDDMADATLLGIVHMVVESATFHGAVAKGGAAATRLTKNEVEPTVDDYTLIYDLEEALAPQLADRWPTLPAAVHVASAAGEQLLAAARDRTGWSGHGASEHHQPAPTRLFDQRGNVIRDESRLSEILDDAADEAWVVPAMALTEPAGENESVSQRPSVPTTEYLDCQNCGRVTDHQFRAHESIPAEMWPRQPIWECQVCGTDRYGPALE